MTLKIILYEKIWKIFSKIVGDALNCFDGLDAVFCLTLPGGEFR